MTTTRQIFMQNMEFKGYDAFIHGSIVLGYSIKNGQTYIGYDESCDKPYYLAVKSTGKVIKRSYLAQPLTNFWLLYEFPLTTKETTHLEDNRYVLNGLIIECSPSQYSVTNQDGVWLASFAYWEDCKAYCENYRVC